MKLENYTFTRHYFLILLFSSISYCLSAQITSYPYTMSFEAGETVDWGALAGTIDCSTEWVNTQNPIDAAAGASQAHDGVEYLIAGYTTCSVGQYVKTLGSPQFDLSSLSQPEFIFYSHIYGIDGGTLELEVSTDGGTNWSTAIWSINTATDPQQSSGTDPWTMQTVDLSAYMGQTVQFQFVATANGAVIAFGIDAITVQDASQTVNGNGDVTYMYDEAGNRTARTVAVNLLDPSEQEIIAATRSIDKEDIEDPRTDLYKIYPNPTSNYVHVESLGDNVDANVTVFDMMGRQLARSSMTNGKHRVDMTSYEAGSYVLWIQYADTVVTRKVLKY